MPTETAPAPAPAPPELRRGEEAEMTFTEHLGELRNRLLVAVLAVTVAGVASFPFMPTILKVVETTFLHGIQLHVFSPAEIIRVYLKLSILVGLVVAFPVVLYEIYAFVAPALDRRVRARVVWYAIPSLFM